MNESASQPNPEQTPENDAYTGPFKNKHMENAFYWAAQAAGWLTDGPNAGLGGRYYVEVVAGQPVIVLDESFNDETTKALVDGLREYNFPASIKSREMRNENRRIFIQPNDTRLTANYVDGWREWDSHDGFSDTNPTHSNT